MRAILVTLLCLGLVLSAAASALDNEGAWDSTNDPLAANSEMELSLQALPLSSKLYFQPWSDTYWPSYVGGIAQRYMTEEDGFGYKSPSKKELNDMSIRDRKNLSPAEKYDAFMARYDYPTVKAERSRTSPHDATWEGLCHGWAPAALIFHNPSPANLTNPDGILIPFGSSDVKALLTYFAATYRSGESDDDGQEWFIGQRCNSDLDSHPDEADLPECADLNAGTLHVLLANLLQGGNARSFVLDVDRSGPVWNQPVYSMTAERTGENKFKTVMTYGVEVQPTFEKVKPYTRSKTYEYTLELDDSGMLIGGAYDDFERPDFAWMIKLPAFYGYFAKVKDVYAASVANDPHTMSVGLTKIPMSTRRPLAMSATHTIIEKPSGTVKASIRSGERRTFSIAPPAASTIVLAFRHLNTERNRAIVKIYEGVEGEGALVHVLSAESLEHADPISINAPAVTIEFVADKFGNAQRENSFEAVFFAKQ